MAASKKPFTPRDVEVKIKYSPNGQLLIQSLKDLIKKNKNLQHLNLTKVGLSEYMVCELSETLKKSKSLISLHLCGNGGRKGISDETKSYLRERIRCKPPIILNSMKATELTNNIFERTVKEIVME